MSTETDREQTIEGIPASGGIAIGVVARFIEEEGVEQTEGERDEAVEMERLETALAEADRALAEIEELARRDVQERAKIFEAMRMMLHDPVLADGIRKRITEDGMSAHAGIVAELGTIAGHFTESNDETMRTRVEDIRALQSHLLASLVAARHVYEFERDSILVLTSLLPSDTLLFTRNGARAFVVESGGINSHSAILARSLGVPMVAGLSGIAGHALTGQTVIVDGYTGHVVVNPSSTTLASYNQRKLELDRQRELSGSLRDLPAETTDGVKISIGANLDRVDEIESAIENGAGEIGLMRTEYLVMDRGSDVTMEEQLACYRKIAERAYPLVVTLRAFDIGSEKLAGATWDQTSPLGMRGARLLLARPEILRRQVEAALRASTAKNLRLMLPMVTSVDEIRAFRSVLEDIRTTLRTAGVPFDESMPVGAMIETPAAALIADALALEVDFLSIGSNDLVQYTLAVDRNDEALASYYDESHPGFLRLLRAVAVAARRRGVDLTLCGELAARPEATALLIGLGLRCFSVSPNELAALKQRIRTTSAHGAELLARRCLRAATGGEVRGIIRD